MNTVVSVAVIMAVLVYVITMVRKDWKWWSEVLIKAATLFVLAIIFFALAMIFKETIKLISNRGEEKARIHALPDRVEVIEEDIRWIRARTEYNEGVVGSIKLDILELKNKQAPALTNWNWVSTTNANFGQALYYPCVSNDKINILKGN